MAQKKSFVLYQDFEALFDELTAEERGNLISAIFAYTRDGSNRKESLSDAARMAFICIKNTLDRDREAYDTRCAQNSENGRLGGRPKKATESEKTERFSEKAKKADNDNGSGNEIETDSDTVSDSERSEAPQQRACAREEKKRRYQSKKSPDRSFSNSSFDTDDFFQAALERSRHWDEPL